jgi:hypothetical protein
MDDRFEATFIVDTPQSEVWRRLRDAEPLGDRRAEGEPPAHPLRWWLPAFESPADELDCVEGRSVRLTKTAEPCAGTEIAISLEASGRGTKVTVVQSGFGVRFDQMLNSLAIGWSHIVADLALFLQTGARGGRHLAPWASLGCTVREIPAGLEVDDVFGGLAVDVGLEPGDVLLAVGNAPVAFERELQTLMRVFGTGDKLELTWARGGDILRATSVL